MDRSIRRIAVAALIGGTAILGLGVSTQGAAQGAAQGNTGQRPGTVQGGRPSGAGGPTRTPPRATGPAAPATSDVPRTAAIRGQVLAADSGSPIRLAQVRLTSPDARESRLATTDAQGRFDVPDLPAGRYTIAASKAGFVSLQYGQRRPSESGTPIELGVAQTIEKLLIALPRGSVLGGRVTDEFGEPIANASVNAMRYGYQGGVRRLMGVGGGNSRDTTDDQGHYRLFGLPPGDYYISASLRTGGVEVTDAPRGEVSGYAATYYPGTPNVGEAQRVALGLSQENTNVSFALIATRLVRLTGQVITSSGGPAWSGMVMLLPPAGTSAGMAEPMRGGGRIDGNGEFRLPGVAPGRYQLQARTGDRGNGEFARIDVTVGNENADGIILVAAPGAKVTGTVVTDTGEPFSIRAQQVQVTARPATPEAQFGGIGGGGASARVADNWTFELTDIVDARVFRTNAPSGWTLAAVRLNGQDITDTPVEVATGQTLAGVQVVMTQKTVTVSGLVTDAQDRPVLDATVVVFPASDELWGYQSRFVKSARPDQEGRYRVTALPPGQSYMAVVVQGLEEGQAGDPEFLASIRARGTPFSVDRDTAVTLNLKATDR